MSRMRFTDWDRRRLVARLKRAAILLAVPLAVALAVYVGWFTPTKRAVRHRLGEADAQARAALDERLDHVLDLFIDGRKGAKDFAEEALSWSGKWAAVKGVVDDRTHHQFLKEAFARHVLTEDAVEAALLSACRGFVADLDGVEADLLVKLRADLDLPARPPQRVAGGGGVVSGEQKELARRVVGIARTDLAVGAGREAAVFVVSDVAARAAVRAAASELGVHGGVLAAGAGSMVATVGVGIGVAIILDYILDEVLKLFGYDAHAKIAREVESALYRMQDALIRKAESGWPFGEEKKAGALRGQLEAMAAERSKQRQQAVQLMLKGERR